MESTPTASEKPPLWEAVVTLVFIGIMFVVLAIDRLPPDFVMYFTVVMFAAVGIISMKEALAGFANEGMITVMVLFIVSAGVEASGALEYIKKILFFRYKSGEALAFTLLRIAVLLGGLSAFLNNTPIVAIFIPVLDDFAKRNGISPSKLMLPLSYSVILGGTLSLLGTSTNLVAIGLAAQYAPGFHMGLFDMARIGLPVMISGTIYIMFCADWILPDSGRTTTLEVLDNPREYVVVVQVEDNPVIAGKSIEEAGLRNLPGLFLVDIIRGGHSIPAPAPTTVLYAHDHLMLAGDVDTVLALIRARGLRLVEDPQHADLRQLQGERLLVEAVVGTHSSVSRKTVRELQFRSKFEAAIIAVHRGGERITQRVGDIELQPGDALLLVTGPRFINTFGRGVSSVFALVRPLTEYSSVKFNYKAIISLIVVLVVVVVAGATDVSILLLAFFGVAIMFVARIVDAEKAHRAVNLEVLIMIAAGFALSSALSNSGAAELVATGLIRATLRGGPVALLTMFYIVAVVFNAVVTNNAAVAIMFPIGLYIQSTGIVTLETLIYVLMFAGSADFSTPIGYQTNLMVMGPGGYRFLDYTRFGLPLQIISGFFCIVVAINLDQWWIVTLAIIAAAVVLAAIVALWNKYVGVSPVAWIVSKVPAVGRLVAGWRSGRRRRSSSPRELEMESLTPNGDEHTQTWEEASVDKEEGEESDSKHVVMRI